MVYLAIAALALVIAGIAWVFILGTRVAAMSHAPENADDDEARKHP